MKFFEANLSINSINVLIEILKNTTIVEKANLKLFYEFGISNFFSSQQEYEYFKRKISSEQNIIYDRSQTEYGDFQTNAKLAQSISFFLKNQKKTNPQLVIEPTCGKGNFIIAALSTFDNIEKIVGIEIYKPYIWETKFNIIEYYITNPNRHKPKIEIFHFNVFDFNFKTTLNKSYKEILVLGNPPWVTNSKLGSLESNNLPKKSNFKNLNGFDAITGKGNFDIGEYITLMMLENFQNSNGHLAFLVKNSVIKNILFYQHKRNFKISEIEKLNIDAKKEFGATVDAALLFCKFNSNAEYKCKEFNFYQPTKLLKEFGWIAKKFVSNIELYLQSYSIEGICPFEWRQGIKHDLSSIMELKKINEYYINGKQEQIYLEEDLIYGFIKSSDLKQIVINQPKKFTIVTQKKIGQDTSFIKLKYPKIYDYLQSNKTSFDNRKSNIYNNKPDFSIFGVGEYSFMPFKVAISGLYKNFSFCLILPYKNKPLMLDDTCYFLGFDNIEFAAYTTILLNSKKSIEYLKSLIFFDAKRVITKEILMRIDLFKLSTEFSETMIRNELNSLNSSHNLNITSYKWNDFIKELKSKYSLINTHPLSFGNELHD